MKHTPGFIKIVDDAKTRIQEMSIETLQKKMSAGGAPQVLDVREDREWDQGHIPGAQHMGKGIIERDIEAGVPRTDTELVLYCGGGFRSALAADNLQKMGYTNVFSLEGGFRAWKESGADIESP